MSAFYFFSGDRGFTCDDLLTGKKARLVVPDFVPKDGKLSKEAVRRTQCIARARAPIERQAL